MPLVCGCPGATCDGHFFELTSVLVAKAPLDELLTAFDRWKAATPDRDIIAAHTGLLGAVTRFVRTVRGERA